MNLHSDIHTDTKREDCSTLSLQAVDAPSRFVSEFAPFVLAGIVKSDENGDSVTLSISGDLVADLHKFVGYAALRDRVEYDIENDSFLYLPY